MEVCATLPTQRISKPVSAGLFDGEQGQILPLSAHSVLWQISCPTSTFTWAVIVSGNNSIWSEKEREEMIDRALEIYRQQMQNHHAFLWNRLSHEIDDEYDEDDLDSEDECLVDELMVFNVDNDTSDVSDADE